LFGDDVHQAVRFFLGHWGGLMSVKRE